MSAISSLAVLYSTIVGLCNNFINSSFDEIRFLLSPSNLFISLSLFLSINVLETSKMP
jgi:hypothetical protein